MVILENVHGFTIEYGNCSQVRKGNKRGRPAKPASQKITEQLQECGYHVSSRLLKAQEYGVPQFRPRYFIIGMLREQSRDSGVVPDPFALLERKRKSFLRSKGLRINGPVSCGEAISDLEAAGKLLCECPDSPKFRQIMYSGPRTKYQKLMRVRSNGETPDSLRLVRHRPATIARFEQILKTCRSGVGLSAKDKERLKIRKHCVTLLAEAHASHTLTTLPDDLVHYSEPRILTVRESARLQSFPDWFEFKGKYTTGGQLRVKECPRYTQVGNAVPPLVAEVLGLVLLDIASTVSSSKSRRASQASRGRTRRSY